MADRTMSPVPVDARLPIGGEMHQAHDPLYRCVTDSGRSSLRLALRALRGKRLALPNLLCSTIVDVVRSCGIEHGFYRVNEDLSIDYESLGPDFDVLYVIDYFGKPADVDPGRIPRGTIIIQDGVFQPAPVAGAHPENWIWFNSFRKISPLSDGSALVSTLALDAADIRPGPAPFAGVKRRAKSAKGRYLDEGVGSEDGYLELFQEGERLLDAQTEVHAISPHSLSALLRFQQTLADETKVRQRNYDLLASHLGEFAVELDRGFKTLYVMSVDRRDALRQHLARHRVYLPVHWPDPYGLKNPLSERILSIPVDSRYGEPELMYVVSRMREFLGSAA
jgi:hypothetical protein